MLQSWKASPVPYLAPASPKKCERKKNLLAQMEDKNVLFENVVRTCVEDRAGAGCLVKW